MENLLSISEIAEKLGREESCIRAYLDRGEFNKYRTKSNRGKMRFVNSPKLFARLRELVYNRYGEIIG